MKAVEPDKVHAKVLAQIEDIKKRFESYPLTETDRTIIGFQLDIVERANDRLLKKAKSNG
jgi:hypothetical protein